MSYLNWENIAKKPKEVKRLLGIEYEQLEQLIEYSLLLDKKQQEEQEKKKVRLIKAGGGRKEKLSKQDQIIMTLLYLKQHPTFQVLGMMFGVSETTANDAFNYWQKILEEALPPSLIEQVKKNDNNLDEILEKLTEYELLIDSEEQDIERALDYEEQKKYYSAKKKSHTFKNQVITLPKGQEIVDVVAGEPGPKSDIKICRENLDKFREEQKLKGDKAYVGESQIITPKKKPKKGELTEAEKEENKKISSVRIFVEHLIRIIKIWRITQERFRLKKPKYKSVFLTVCGLVRLRIESLIIQIVKTENTQEIIDVLLSHSFGKELHFEQIST